MQMSPGQCIKTFAPANMAGSLDKCTLSCSSSLLDALQEECFRLSPATEALKWQAAAGALGLAQTLRRRGHASLQSATSIRVLADVVEALQTADSQCLLPLLACLRYV